MTMVFWSSPFFQGIEQLLHAVIELPRAAIVERGNLPRVRWCEFVPFIFEIGAADEFIDIEVHRCFVFPS